MALYRNLSRFPINGLFNKPNIFSTVSHRKFFMKPIMLYTNDMTKENTLKNEILIRENEKGNHTQKNTLTQNFYDCMEKGCQDIRTLDYFIEQGVDITSNNNYALILACRDGNLEVMKKLVIHGADITTNRDRLLNIASAMGHFEIIKFLVYSNRFTGGDLAEPFTLACKNGHLPIVKFLHDNGAPIEGSGFRGEPIKMTTDSDVKKYLDRFTNGNNGTTKNDKWISNGRLIIILSFISGMVIISSFVSIVEADSNPHQKYIQRVFK